MPGTVRRMTDEVPNENETLIDELNRRRELIEASTGYESGRHREALSRAFRVFSENLGELKLHVKKFVDTEEMPDSLGEKYESELVRLFHNFLASIGTLRDVQRTVHRKLWPEKPEEDPSENQGDSCSCGKNTNNKKTAWELAVWDPKVKEFYDKDEYKFLVDLRNYTVHYALPVPLTSTKINWEVGQPVVQKNDMHLKKSTLLKFRSWSGPAKRYMRSQPDQIQFLPVIEDYSQRVHKFYKWFWDATSERLDPEIMQIKSAAREINLWVAEEKAFNEWSFAHTPPPEGCEHDPLPELRRKWAEAKRDRWEYGSTGWRVFSVSPDRTIEPNSEDTWGLTLRSRSVRFSRFTSEF